MTIKVIKWWILVFLATLAALYLFGLVPSKLDEFFVRSNKLEAASETEILSGDSANTGQNNILIEKEKPLWLSISSVSIDSPIVTAESTDLKVLDEALKRGVVHYPKSAMLGEEGNVLLFGHSSRLNNIRNVAYKALTGIEGVEIGDIITVRSEDYIYKYKVKGVKLVYSGDELISLKTDGKILTISTCNTLGAKEERIIVTADFIDKNKINKNTSINAE